MKQDLHRSAVICLIVDDLASFSGLQSGIMNQLVSEFIADEDVSNSGFSHIFNRLTRLKCG